MEKGGPSLRRRPIGRASGGHLHEAHGLFGHPLISHPTCIRLPCLPDPVLRSFHPSVLRSGKRIGTEPQARWTQSYDAGYLDKKGVYAGGSEIMHIISHKGKLYASNGFWVDARWVIPPDGQKQSAQVLRLDSLAGNWQVDLDMGQTNDRGLAYMKATSSSP